MKNKLLISLSCCLLATCAFSCGGDDSSDPENTCTQENEIMCGTSCVDVKTDDNHCGDCDTKCEENEHCDEGSCKPKELTCDKAKNELKCGDACVVIKDNDNHCGACNNKCEADEKCIGTTCQKQTPECKAEDGKAFCEDECVDITSNDYHCGGCNVACGSNMKCENKACACEEGYVPIDGDLTLGCEEKTGDECQPGETRECWEFDFEPAEGSACKKGVQKCIGGEWDFICEGQIGPSKYNPERADEDLNCNGIVDKDEDLDGDGWTKAQGDCCDDLDSCSATTEGIVKEQDLASINPGATEIAGDKVDNNCNGKVDETVTPVCTHTKDDKFPAGTGNDVAQTLARAMDICGETVTAESNLPGIISATLLNGMKEESVHAYSYFADEFKSYLMRPLKGDSFAVLSTGKAIDVSRFQDTGSGNKEREVVTTGPGNIPALYSQSKPGFKLQSNIYCPTADKIFDVAALSTEMRAPTNAKGFSVKFRFFTSEYNTYVCEEFNDFFVILLESKHPDTPADHNIAFDKNHNPISVNNAFFTSCTPMECNAQKACPASMTCDQGVCKTKNDGGKLDDPCADGADGIKAAETFNTYASERGGTSWLETQASVVGGEVIKLHFYIWDTGDSKRDSLVIIDDFQWLYKDVELGTLPVVIN